MKIGLRLEDLEVYKVAMEIGEKAYEVALKWPYFDKITLGRQFVEAADSIGLNLAEGYGRFHYKENRNFCYYGRGSAKEALTCARKAANRNLLSDSEFQLFTNLFDHFSRLIFGYINSIGSIADKK